MLNSRGGRVCVPPAGSGRAHPTRHHSRHFPSRALARLASRRKAHGAAGEADVAAAGLRTIPLPSAALAFEVDSCDMRQSSPPSFGHVPQRARHSAARRRRRDGRFGGARGLRRAQRAAGASQKLRLVSQVPCAGYTPGSPPRVGLASATSIPVSTDFGTSPVEIAARAWTGVRGPHPGARTLARPRSLIRLRLRATTCWCKGLGPRRAVKRAWRLVRAHMCGEMKRPCFTRSLARARAPGGLQAKPWCIFGLWTAERTFFFCAGDDVVAEAFIVGRAGGRRFGAIRSPGPCCASGRERAERFARAAPNGASGAGAARSA